MAVVTQLVVTTVSVIDEGQYVPGTIYTHYNPDLLSPLLDTCTFTPLYGGGN